MNYLNLLILWYFENVRVLNYVNSGETYWISRGYYWFNISCYLLINIIWSPAHYLRCLLQLLSKEVYTYCKCGLKAGWKLHCAMWSKGWLEVRQNSVYSVLWDVWFPLTGPTPGMIIMPLEYPHRHCPPCSFGHSSLQLSCHALMLLSI